MEKESNTKNNKNIAKNTLLLYIRLLVTMGINIYSSRIILNTLGIDDYGIYNIVAGVIVLFSFLNSSMSSATSRFITYELGKEVKDQNLQRVFSASCTIHLVIAIVIIMLGETIGLYLLQHKLVIPPDRKVAAMVVYQVSIFIVFFNILQTPYTASIFAHERMNVYASIEILNSILKLVVVLLLPFYLNDKLIIYSIMLLVVALIIFSMYVIYCHQRFQGCKFTLTRDKTFLKPMSTFSGWDLYGNMSTVARTQGINILLNIFFGPVLNAANGIAIQVQGAVNTFATNLLLAVRPQIVKNYAKNNIQYMLWLLNNTVKITTVLLFILCIPLIIEMPFILKIWLDNFPSETIILTRLTLVFIFFANISLCLMSVLHATGQIKKPSIINGSIYLIVLPITYCTFKLGYPAYTPFVFNIILVIIGTSLNAFYIKQHVTIFSVSSFLKDCIIPVTCVAIGAIIPSWIIITYMDSSWSRLIVILITNTLFSITLAYMCILDKEIKQLVNNKIKEYVRKRLG